LDSTFKDRLHPGSFSLLSQLWTGVLNESPVPG
jgi:hypothetical protein